jgi:phage shock protein C
MLVNRRLYRCRHNRRLAGVAGGVAEFFGLNPTHVRILWALSILLGGTGILLYVALALIVPLEPGSDSPAQGSGSDSVAGHRHETGTGPVLLTSLVTVVGLGLVVVGALVAIDTLLPGWTGSWQQLWPVVLVGAGGLLVARSIQFQSAAE